MRKEFVLIDFAGTITHTSPENFEDLADALAFIGQNFTFIIISSSPSSTIKSFLTQHNLTQHFKAILGSDLSVSKTAKFRLILKHYKIKAAECVYVTDTLADIQAAHQAGIPSIAVTWGLDNEDTLRQGNPATVIDYPTQLRGAIEQVVDFSAEYDED